VADPRVVTPAAGALSLQETFAPVPTAAWEEQARNDLNGRDYAQLLLWRTDEGVLAKPFYRSEDVAGLEGPLDVQPGTSPFMRGHATAWHPADAPAWASDAIRADRLHDAGATAVQELAWAIAEGVERLLVEAAPGDTPVAVSAAGIEFVFAVGSTYFVEIAKLRAARLLWASVLRAFDVPGHAMRLHVRTARANKSVLDPHTNLLRATTEAMSAVIGGADTLLVEPHGYEAHLAVNVQHLLAEEAHLDAVADPAAGSYFIEALTDSLAREAWALFQQVEADGGYAAYVDSGQRDRLVQASAQAREQAVAFRRRTLVGVNSYPDLEERMPLAEPGPVDHGDGSLPALRLAAPFEAMRRRTARHAAATGRIPVVHLLTRGDAGVRMARANFCLNFFGCAGLAVTQGAALPTGADLVVLCSADDAYPALAREVLSRVSVPVVVAGHPTALVATLASIGVEGFVHARSDAVQTLSHWQDRLGLAP